MNQFDRNRVFLSLTVFLLGFDHFYRVLPSFTEFSWWEPDRAGVFISTSLIRKSTPAKFRFVSDLFLFFLNDRSTRVSTWRWPNRTAIGQRWTNPKKVRVNNINNNSNNSKNIVFLSLSSFSTRQRRSVTVAKRKKKEKRTKTMKREKDESKENKKENRSEIDVGCVVKMGRVLPSFT